MVPSPIDKVEVNGVELTVESSLQTALTARGLSTSGSKQKCFQWLLNFQKKLEMEILSQQLPTLSRMTTVNQSPNFAEPSITGGAGQAQLDALFLSTLVSWLHQFSSQSRCTQNIRIVRSSGTPTISFDFCYAKSVPERADPKDIFRPSFALS